MGGLEEDCEVDIGGSGFKSKAVDRTLTLAIKPLKVYAILVITSRFVIFFHLVLLYHLARGRFPAPTTSSDPHLEDDAEALVDAVMPPAILTDEDAAAGLASMAMDELNGRKDKQPKEKRRWRKKWERFQTEHGMGAVVVLGDLAVSPSRRGIVRIQI